MSFKDLIKDPHLNLNCSANTIKNALYKRGYHRRLARYKPFIFKKNHVLRLEFAYKHLHWSEKQWWEVLWSDETWVTAGTHRKVWVTRLVWWGGSHPYHGVMERG